MFTAKIYGREIQAKTIQGIKCKATKIANQYCNPVDEMFVTRDGGQTLKWTRINRKYPTGVIYYGEWN